MGGEPQVLQPVQINRREIKNALETNPEFFIQFFLQDELTYPVPEFHKTIFMLMTSQKIRRFACAIPRDHAKTTLAKLAVVWYFLFSDYRFILYVSNTADIAVAACQDVITFLESENFQAVFGSVHWYIKREGDGTYKFDLNGKTCILRARGAGQQVRGINIDNQRPQLAIVDDLEDNDNIATQPLFLKLKKWVYGPFLKCLDKFHNKVIWLGNMIAHQCMLREHCESSFWYSMRYGCLLADGTALWKDAWSIEKLKLDFQEYLENGMADIWFAEMMNLPMAGGRGLIQASEIQFRPRPEPGAGYGFLTIDPAISDKTWAHRTAVVVHYFVDEIWQIVDYEFDKGIDPIALFDIVIALCYKWQINIVGIESVAYQSALKYVFDYMCIVNGIEFMQFVDLTAAGRKVQRLAGWCGFLKSGAYCLSEGDFNVVQQLLTFDPTKKENDDDLIDSCAYGPQMLELYLYEIMQTFTMDPANQNRSMYNIAAI